jgi:hypothetical protein
MCFFPAFPPKSRSVPLPSQRTVACPPSEFGCNINWYPNATVCAPNVRQLQISSCAAVCATDGYMCSCHCLVDHTVHQQHADYLALLVPRARRLVQGFTSWLFWTYDSNDVQPDWYGMVDDDGAIDAVLAPANHADPCKAP